jgi:hypothetical protein
MRHDPKIRRLISKFGIEGYGWYCLILESISETITTQNPMPELEETSADLADFYNGNSAKIDEIVAYMVTSGLLEYNEITNQITCHKIYKLLEANQTRSEAIRQLISSYKTNKGLPDKPSETVTDKSERKEKKRKEKEKNNGVLEKMPWDFQEDWNHYKHLAQFKQIKGTVSTSDLEPIRLHCEPYTVEEIKQAINNYGLISQSWDDFEFVPKYPTLISFLSKGVEACSGDISRFKKKKSVSQPVVQNNRNQGPQINPKLLEVEQMKRDAQGEMDEDEELF